MVISGKESHLNIMKKLLTLLLRLVPFLGMSQNPLVNMTQEEIIRDNQKTDGKIQYQRVTQKDFWNLECKHSRIPSVVCVYTFIYESDRNILCTFLTDQQNVFEALILHLERDLNFKKMDSNSYFNSVAGIWVNTKKYSEVSYSLTWSTKDLI